MKNNNLLSAPQNYWDQIPNGTPAYINGCGSSGINSKLVPDTLLGLSIGEACNIHDYMYEEGKDKSSADKLFLKNMLTLIDQDSNSKVLKLLRKANAYLYYFGVKIFGHLYFNKNQIRSL